MSEFKVLKSGVGDDGTLTRRSRHKEDVGFLRVSHVFACIGSYPIISHAVALMFAPPNLCS